MGSALTSFSPSNPRSRRQSLRHSSWVPLRRLCISQLKSGSRSCEKTRVGVRGKGGRDDRGTDFFLGRNTLDFVRSYSWHDRPWRWRAASTRWWSARQQQKEAAKQSKAVVRFASDKAEEHRATDRSKVDRRVLHPAPPRFPRCQVKRRLVRATKKLPSAQMLPWKHSPSPHQIEHRTSFRRVCSKLSSQWGELVSLVLFADESVEEKCASRWPFRGIFVNTCQLTYVVK